MSLLQFYHDQHVQLPIVTTEASCNGKTFIVTGANTGLGFEAAKHFVKCRSTRVILAVRSLERGGEAKTRIEADTGVTGVAEVWQLDLSSYSSIKAFTSRVDALDRLDATIENAGIGTSIFTLSEEYETSITINVVGTFLLASLILPKLQSTAVKTGAKTHLAVVGSGAGFYAAKQLEKLPANVDILKYLSTKDKDMTNR
jgi:NAD(P)-dependent dehydrogenase (short-subunit alcohol dehydrogenase family)